MGVFVGDNSLMVITHGPGKLTLLSFQSNAHIKNHIGSKTTNDPGVTRWIIGFSHTFERFAFFWEGKGQAVYRIGSNLLTDHVGTSVSKASLVTWGSDTITTQDVTSEAKDAVNRDNATTFWALPNAI